MPLQTDPHFDDPTEVSDFLLEITRMAILAGDFETFLSRCRLPQTIGTFAGTRILSGPDDLRPVFHAVCAHLATIGALDMRRRTLAARFVDADQVEATFSSQYLLPGLQLTSETVAHGRLMRTDGRWQIAEHHYATDNQKLQRALIAHPAQQT